MKLFVVLAAAFAVAVSANANEKSHDDSLDVLTSKDAVETKLHSLASLLEARSDSELEVEAGVGWGGRRRRRWHGHWPHWHHPHGHWPHGHRPHIHWPHGHIPHGHRPHIHVPVEKWAKDAIRGIADGLKSIMPGWVKDILNTLDDIIRDPGKAIIQCAQAALKAIGKAITAATRAVKRLASKALDSAKYVVNNYIKPIVREMHDLVKQIEVKVEKLDVETSVINGFGLSIWLCPSAKTKSFTFPDLPTTTICIPSSIIDKIKQALAYIWNAITGSRMDWRRIDLRCHYNFGMTFQQSVSAEASKGLGISVAVGVEVARGIGIGCNDNDWMAGFILGAAKYVEIEIGFSTSPLAASVSSAITVEFFPGEVDCKGWECIPGFNFIFSVGAEGGIMGGDLDASVSIITSVPTFDFGCHTRDHCARHKTFGACPICASTSWFCGVINWLPWVRCNGHEICAVQIPTGMYCHGCSWTFDGVAMTFGIGGTSQVAKLTFSLNFAIGFNSMPLIIKIATSGNAC